MLIIIYSRPSQYRCSLDWRKTSGIPKRQYWDRREYNLKKPYLGLEMGGSIGKDNCNIPYIILLLMLFRIMNFV